MYGGCNVALGGGCGCPLGVPENLLFALFLPTKSAKKERKKGLGRSPKDVATTMGKNDTQKVFFFASAYVLL